MDGVHPFILKKISDRLARGWIKNMFLRHIRYDTRTIPLCLKLNGKNATKFSISTECYCK